MSVTLIGQNNGYGYGTYHLDLGLYPDNTPVVDFEEAWNESHGKFKAIVIRALSIQDLVTGLMVAHSIRERGGEVRNLILPHVPGGRQDRLKWEGDWLFTLKYVARLINDMNFPTVVTLDPHSLATTALIDRLLVPELRIPYLISKVWDKQGQQAPTYSGIIAPDAGASKRAETVAKQFENELPVYYAKKHRDPATNKLSGFSIDDLPSNQHYLVVDDLCDAGGTFLGLAEVIKENSATADLFVTHGLFTKGTEQLAEAYGTLYATDSVDRPRERVKYFNVTEGMNYYA